MSEKTRFTLRIPANFHKALKLMADREDVSINHVIRHAIEMHPRFYLYLETIKKEETK